MPKVVPLTLERLRRTLFYRDMQRRDHPSLIPLIERLARRSMPRAGEPEHWKQPELPGTEA